MFLSIFANVDMHIHKEKAERESDFYSYEKCNYKERNQLKVKYNFQCRTTTFL